MAWFRTETTVVPFDPPWPSRTILRKDANERKGRKKKKKKKKKRPGFIYTFREKLSVFWG